jgi:predicted nucleic acid-binding protein
MSVLLDTSVLVAAANPQDRNAGRAVEMLNVISSGEHGAPFLTDYVVDEALTLTWVRTKRSKVVLQLADWLLAPETRHRPGRLVFVGDEAFGEAARLHRRHHARLSFTDCTSLAVMTGLRIEQIATFEAGFDGLVSVLR